MPIPTPLTWTAGALPAADMSDHIRDPIRWMAGFLDGPKGIVSVSSSIPVPLTTSPGWTTLAFDTADGNVAESGDELWDASTPELIVWPYDCWAIFGAGMRTEATTANKALRFIIDSDEAQPIVQHDNVGVSTPAFTTINVTRLYKFTVGQTLEVQGFQDAGVTVNAVVEGKASPFMWAMWVAVNGI